MRSTHEEGKRGILEEPEKDKRPKVREEDRMWNRRNKGGGSEEESRME